jgi:SAM-dependent methyltransferase
LLLPVGSADPFLVAIGVMDREGRVRPRMRRKFRQINEFLRMVVDVGIPERANGAPLEIVDCGCGNAYLTFALYHYLNHVLDQPARLVGIDVNDELIARRTRQAQELGWDDLKFAARQIVDYRPDRRPDIVVALHACDTATDEALAQAVRWHSRRILAAPCCHHHLQQQLARERAPVPLGPIFDHGVLKERFGDILTDLFRALLLQVVGYRTEVIQFVSPEHTSKNLMLRAAWSGASDGRPAQEYRHLRDEFGLVPRLEELLSDQLPPSIRHVAAG